MINVTKPDKKAYFLVAAAFLFYFFWSLCLPEGMAPDEGMRYDLTFWIYSHNALPRGDQKELINETWGYSYGFTPYLSSLISVVFMKIAAIFSDAEVVLKIASRMSSVLAGTGTVVVSLKIGAICFQEKRYQYLYAILVGFLPQFVFLSSYLNCDCIAVFSVTLIFYYWIRGYLEHWNLRVCVGLGISLGICALSYYFAYAYILCSIFVFFISVLRKQTITGISGKNGGRGYQVFLRANLIFWIAFAVAGWFFIRNFILYDGDFLGMRALQECEEKYAQLDYKPSHHWTYKANGLSVLDMFLKSKWIPGTITSFLAVFGYKNVIVNYGYYMIYLLILGIGCFLSIRWYLRHGYKYRVLYFGGVSACIITVCIHIYSSWSRDHQSQGRYIMEILPVLMLLCTYGYREADSILAQHGKRKICAYGIGLIWLILFLCIFIFYCIPLCTGNPLA